MHHCGAANWCDRTPRTSQVDNRFALSGLRKYPERTTWGCARRGCEAVRRANLASAPLHTLTRTRHEATLLASAVCEAATPAYAQLDFLSVFEEAISVALAVQGGGIPGSVNLTRRGWDCPGGGVCGRFAEVLIDLPELGGTEL